MTFLDKIRFKKKEENKYLIIFVIVVIVDMVELFEMVERWNIMK